jgi:Tfp pilus assembly protein PilZ
MSTVRATPSPSLRIPFVRRCSVDDGAGTREAMLLDLSLQGIFVKSDELIEVGRDVSVQFQTRESVEPIRTTGRVAWQQKEQTHPVHGLPKGYGVRFHSLDQETIRNIARTIMSYCASNPIYRQYL